MVRTAFLTRVVRRTSVGLLFAWLLIFLSSEWVRGQDFRQGYIVKNGNDTVRGLIAYRPGKRGFKECLFKSSKKEKPIHFSPEEIDTYGLLGDKEFVSVTLPRDFNHPGKVFILRLVRGTLNLYTYKGTFVVKKDSLVTLPLPKGKSIKVDGRMVYQENKRYVGLLNLQLEDCSMSGNTTKYTEKELTSLVNNYNRCKGQTPPIKAGNRPATHFDFQAFGGFMQSNLTVNYLTRNTFSPSKTVVGGIGVDVSSPRSNDRFFLSMEAFFVKSIYQGYYETTYNGDQMQQDIYLNVSFLKVPLGFRFNFRGTPDTPYLRLGFAQSFILTKSARTLQDRVTSNGVVQSDELVGGYRFKNPLGMWGAVGYQKSISSRIAIFGEFRFEHNNGPVGTPIQPFSHVVNYNAICGIRY
jgi:hypothetical protein